ncbi:hypothetical protein E2C01_039479 [Portunus trituberculatus]|uniref:Uncharacterized protein n=1 Tax=Portunus trituberculatus TaxID=210409 RepID=A0A5B7FKT2_PORTR|nr:hypothetical protein [Portunus trituberculatus]
MTRSSLPVVPSSAVDTLREQTPLLRQHHCAGGWQSDMFLKAPPYHASQQAFEYTSTSWTIRSPLTSPVQNNNSISNNSSSLAQLTTKTLCNVA